MPSKSELKYLQSMPLDIKIGLSINRIREWLNEIGENSTYISFSGGKDSTVLMDIVRKVNPNITAVFINTGLEYPEIQQFAKSQINTKIIYPKMQFKDVIIKYGYPIISKEVGETIKDLRRYIEKGQDYKNCIRYKKISGELKGKSKFDCSKYYPLLTTTFKCSNECCNVMKKAPAHSLERKEKIYPIIGTLAEESLLRETDWLRNGCNSFKENKMKCKPLSFWTEQDILHYIKQEKLEIAKVYGNIQIKDNQLSLIENGEILETTGCKRTECIFCGFGCHLNNDKRFTELKTTHPKQYDYCMKGGEYNEKGIWQPSKNGLGMKHVIDELNDIYGKGFIKY